MVSKHCQEARVQTLAKRKAVSMKAVVKDTGSNEDMVLLMTKVVPTGEISH